ncbi:hypothetical protein MANES_11G065650v8 [Manihot esculenta]|uniref:Uncharacterized protein n=1 Tax=Manihot esculenta TaxID=3983 RepID=A0ACB7GUW9_MANES|nr:hypothetical protein MANES_11G065650v8 [Manihot esculenta]
MTHVLYDPALLILIAILFCGILRHVPLFISKFPSNNQNPLTKINPHFPALATKGRNARFAQSYHPTALIWSRSHCPSIVLDAYSLHSLFPPYFHSSFPGSCPIFFLSADSAHPIPQLPSMALGHWKIGSNVFTNPNTLIKSTKFSLKIDYFTSHSKIPTLSNGLPPKITKGDHESNSTSAIFKFVFVTTRKSDRYRR